MIYYDLDMLEELARELRFVPLRVSIDELVVRISDVRLRFQNLRTEEDTVAGFEGTADHWHDKLVLMMSEDQYTELNELDILKAIKYGDILISERYVNSQLVSRGLISRKQKQDFRRMENGEEVRIRWVC